MIIEHSTSRDGAHVHVFEREREREGVGPRRRGVEVARKASMERVFGAPAVTSMERVFGAPAVTRHGLPSRLRPAVACLKFRRGAPIGGTVTSELTASSESLAPGWGRNRLGVFHRAIQPPDGAQIRPGGAGAGS